jgi:hypothetical protein
VRSFILDCFAIHDARLVGAELKAYFLAGSIPDGNEESWLMPLIFTEPQSLQLCTAVD